MDESPYASETSLHSQYHRNPQRYQAGNVSNLLDQSLDFRGASNTSASTSEAPEELEQDGLGAAVQQAQPGHRHEQTGPAGQAASNGARQESVQAATARLAGMTIQGGRGQTSDPTAEGAPSQGDAGSAADPEMDLPAVPPLSAQERRERALTKERDDLARMNTILERAVQSLEAALPKVDRMQETIQTTHELMDTYVRLMSQTEHTQRLLLDCEWEMQKDEAEMREAEEAFLRARQEEEARLAREAEEREERERKRQEEADRKAALALHPPAGRGQSARGAFGGPRGGTRGRTGGTTGTRGASTRGVPVRGRGGIPTARGRGTISKAL